MAEILGHRSAVPVSSAAHGAVLRRGRAYVAVPGRHLAVERGGLLALSEGTKVHHLRPSADVLFASMADSLGPRAVAVVLTGAGVDGAAGVRSIRARGGRVLVQDEEECEIPGMPRAAIATGAVDRVLSIDEMPDALMELTRRRRSAPSRAEPARSIAEVGRVAGRALRISVPSLTGPAGPVRGRPSSAVGRAVRPRNRGGEARRGGETGSIPPPALW